MWGPDKDGVMTKSLGQTPRRGNPVCGQSDYRLSERSHANR